MPVFSNRIVRITLFVLVVMALVCLPFAILGEEFVLPLLQTRAQQAWALTLAATALLAADAVAPIPSSLVILYVGAKAGPLWGFVGGAVGLSLGVLAAAWLGRHAVGRLAPRFLPDAELERLRRALQERLGVTLACCRSIPVLAETSVLVAAAMGIPPGRIFRVTLLPNAIVAAVYALAADDSAGTAALTLALTTLASWLYWRWSQRVR
ncbi:MAG: hypothetical protein B9S27_08725 [Opitutia bacterium Tous-C8FEB]|jgi:uncharacterized membrane protein YdjX (TVP38/TMEM64 family)|nr:MAG: hypothetical protein B9S27_08725 [Opitutae bacterium Tous-C8FEB]